MLRRRCQVVFGLVAEELNENPVAGKLGAERPVVIEAGKPLGQGGIGSFAVASIHWSMSARSNRPWPRTLECRKLRLVGHRIGGSANFNNIAISERPPAHHPKSLARPNTVSDGAR